MTKKPAAKKPAAKPSRPPQKVELELDVVATENDIVNAVAALMEDTDDQDTFLRQLGYAQQSDDVARIVNIGVSPDNATERVVELTIMDSLFTYQVRLTATVTPRPRKAPDMAKALSLVVDTYQKLKVMAPDELSDAEKEFIRRYEALLPKD